MSKKNAKNVVVIGTQWGDEGKGKIVDLLTEEIGAVVRFQGGHNAGHTLVINGKKTAYEMLRSLVGSEMCIRDSPRAWCASRAATTPATRWSSTA